MKSRLTRIVSMTSDRHAASHRTSSVAIDTPPLLLLLLPRAFTSVHNQETYILKRYQQIPLISTLGPAYNEHPAITSGLFCMKIINCNV